MLTGKQVVHVVPILATEHVRLVGLSRSRMAARYLWGWLKNKGSGNTVYRIQATLGRGL